MIGSGFTVRVHPVVILSIVDSYKRRESRGGCCNKAIGTLLGTSYYEKNAVEVVNCYGVKYSESKDEYSCQC
ncbi:Mov34:MPN:PAD 1 family protein [Trichuris trichiura]|uniref:Mov34:MPN:PAD 1 family protein n=1 Tax=Trichuris trichiura TaxID=36087 RepID=A0A077ZJX9_TRITR|nr:Mov34:MPN:PAD 1 family protein [Trichuris trichiura]